MGGRLGRRDPLDEILKPLVRPIRRRIDEELHVDPFQRDPKEVAALRPLLKLLCGYFGSEVRGWSNLPKKGPMLVVGNHSGGAGTTDLVFFLDRWLEERGAEEPLYSLAYDLLFAYPIYGPRLRKLGVIPANPRNARAALERGATVAVFPGGDYEVFRPWSKRNRIDFGHHFGFVKVALATGVPVVPMTIHGAHQSTLVLTRGRRFARTSGLNRLHIKVFPFIWNIPFGITPAFVPSIQLPAKVTVHIDEPLDWSRFGRKAANDDKIVRRCYNEITDIMQHRLDALAREHPYPILSRVNELRPSRILQRYTRRATERPVPKRKSPRLTSERHPPRKRKPLSKKARAAKPL